MDTYDYQIDVLDARGQPIGQKKRRDIDRFRDILPSAFVMVMTSDHQVVLAEIGDGSLPKNPYAGLLGCTAATFIRHDESAEDAARRAVRSDLNINPGQMTFISEQMYTWPDSLRRRASLYICEHDGPFQPRLDAIARLVTVERASLLEQIAQQPSKFAPSLISFIKQVIQ